MGMNVGAASGRLAPQMNVTPLVDVVLVLLIIFMVVTPLLTKKFWLHVPKKDEATEPAPPPSPDQLPVVLTYRADGSVHLNSDRIQIELIAQRLQELLAKRGDGVVFFDAESGADYGEAVRVMDLARGAGASHIAVMTETLIP